MWLVGSTSAITTSSINHETTTTSKNKKVYAGKGLGVLTDYRFNNSEYFEEDDNYLGEF